MHSLLRSRLPRLPFRRKPDFDPKTDPIVRVQVYRLRQKLKEYYELEGAQESILVEIPKGHYLPKFEVLQPVASNLHPVAVPQPNVGGVRLSCPTGIFPQPVKPVHKSSRIIRPLCPEVRWSLLIDS